MPEKAEGDKSKVPGISRLEKIRKDAKDPNLEPEMPPCDVATHLLDYLYEIGPCLGDEAITHTELDHWQRNTGIELDSWQCRTLRMLSRAHMSEAFAATKRDCPAPWNPSADVVEPPSSVARSLEAAMMSLMEM